MNLHNYDFSVILPTYNSVNFIVEAIDSVKKAGYGLSYEIIVIDDGSTDLTKQVVKKLGNNVRYLFQKRQGPASARNLGLHHATGKYIAFIDADDVWSHDHFKILMNVFSLYPETKVAMGYTQRFIASASDPCAHLSLNQWKRYGNPILLPSLGCGLFKREAFPLVGTLNSEYLWHEDVDWYLRARENGISIKISKKVVKYYRLHDNNTTKDWQPTDRRILTVLASSLIRRHNKKLPSLKEFEISN